METQIENWLDKLPTKKRTLALKVRDIVLNSDSSVKELIKWGNLTFTSSGNLGWIISYVSTDYINLGFFNGTRLSDPQKLLEGTGKGLRHQKIRTEKDIDKKQIASWVKQSIKLNKNDK
jgi:hypothetical protein